jgi:peptidoglycan/LPS O-acetylase OafA/YrhL
MRSSPDERLDSVDALRGIAALAVFVFHVGVFADFPKRTLPPITIGSNTFASIPSPVGLGASGVNLFFVVSGFCLALQRLRASEPCFSRGELLVYARNRIARIVPVYWAVLAMSAWVAHPAHHGDLGLLPDVATHAVFAHGFHPSTFISLHGGAWSMATEVQFYAAFPLIVLAARRVGFGRVAAGGVVGTLVFRVAAASLLPSTAATPASVSWSVVAAYSLLGRLGEFVLGMYLAYIYAKADRHWDRRFRWLWVALLGPALYARGWAPAWSGDWALGCLYFAIVGAVVFRSRQSARASRVASVAAAFGRSSYSFFLIHFLVLEVLRATMPRGEQGAYGYSALLIVAGLPISVAGGVLMYRYLELPMWNALRARRRTPRGVVLAA